MATTLTHDGHRLQLAVNRNKPLVAGTVSLRIARHGKPVNKRARPRHLHDGWHGSLAGPLPQTAAGLYSHCGPILGMSGRWSIRLDIAPRRAARFTVSLVDQVGT